MYEYFLVILHTTNSNKTENKIAEEMVQRTITLLVIEFSDTVDCI